MREQNKSRKLKITVQQSRSSTNRYLRAHKKKYNLKYAATIIITKKEAFGVFVASLLSTVKILLDILYAFVFFNSFNLIC
jgi:hypothetical protein